MIFFQLFATNAIPMDDFFAWYTVIKNKTLQKINALVLHGPTNAGKSLLIDCLIKFMYPEEIPRDRDNSNFHLDQLPNAAIALFEEPLIVPNNVGTWKLLLEGRTIKTDIKHRDKEPIKRIPIIITTAQPITNNIDLAEKIQVNQRIKIISFTHTITHRTDSYTLDKYITANKLPRPPATLTTSDFLYLYATTYDAIQQNILDIEQHTLNPKRLQPTAAHIYNLQHHYG